MFDQSRSGALPPSDLTASTINSSCSENSVGKKIKLNVEENDKNVQCEKTEQIHPKKEEQKVIEIPEQNTQDNDPLRRERMVNLLMDINLPAEEHSTTDTESDKNSLSLESPKKKKFDWRQKETVDFLLNLGISFAN